MTHEHESKTLKKKLAKNIFCTFLGFQNTFGLKNPNKPSKTTDGIS